VRTVDAMTVHVHDDVHALARAAADEAAGVICDAVTERGQAAVMFASGNSQLEFLDVLTATPDLPWSQVVGFHMDEYLGIPGSHPASFRRYMRERIVERVHPATFHDIHGDTGDPSCECDRYAELLCSDPLDLCCLGVGE